MKIPKKLNILGHPILVYRSNDALELDECDRAMGLAHLLSNKIGVCHRVDGEDVSESMVAETFMHEIFHHVGSKLGLELEEAQIAGMACGVLQVIRDNKIDFLSREVDMGKKGKGGKKKAAPVVKTKSKK